MVTESVKGKIKMLVRRGVGYCTITNEMHCKCLNKQGLGTPLEDVDMRAVLRKLFTDHAVFTALVLKSIVDKAEDTGVLLERLLGNQKDIGDQVAPVIGVERGAQLTQLLTEHIQLAGAVITAAARPADAVNTKDGLMTKLRALLDQGNRVATFLTSLNPEKLPLNVTSEMFASHNRSVFEMTKARIEGDFNREISLYDAYYNEILALSDALVNAL